MMRLLGVLTGSALAVAALVVFIGIPEFTAESDAVNDVVVTLPIRAAGDGEPAPAEPQPGTAGPVVAEASVAEDNVPVGQPAAADPADIPEVDSVTQAPTADPIVQPAVINDDPLHWYAFWSPFRSEVAASGFVDQLQRVTGLDYRVVKLKPGVYEVAFAYGDDNEITANLSQISSATGLQLPDSR